MASCSVPFVSKQPCLVLHGNRFSSLPTRAICPGPASSLCLHSALRKTVPTAAAWRGGRGGGLQSKDTEEAELSCFPFSSRVAGAPSHLPEVRLAVEEGKEGEQGKKESPRFGLERCTAEVSPTPPCKSRPAPCNHSPSRLKRLLCGASKRAHKPLPAAQSFGSAPEPPPPLPFCINA